MTISRALTLTLAFTAMGAAAQAEEPAGEFHRFHAAVLIGGSHNGDLNALTFGGDVEFRPTRPIGIGFTGEHVNEPFRENVWIVPVVLHPMPRFKLSVGPGIERAREAGEGHHVAQHALLRVGATYDIPLTHGWTLDPDIAVDFVNGERVVVYAMAIGKEFGATGGHRTGHARAGAVRRH